MFKKIQKLATNAKVKKAFQKLATNAKVKKAFTMCMCMALTLCMMAPACFAVDGATVTDVSPEDAATQVFGFISEQLNFTTILSVLGVVIGAALAMVLGWWAIRKIGSALMKAFKSGKLKI